jgi:hypothetical protein
MPGCRAGACAASEEVTSDVLAISDASIEVASSSNGESITRQSVFWVINCVSVRWNVSGN